MQDFENQKKNTNDENVQYLDFQQPSGSSENEIGVQQKGGNTDTEVERNLENIKFEFEKYVDVGLWPDLLNNDFINFVLSHEMTDFQNKDPKNKYTASMKKYKEQNRSFSNRYFTRKIKNGQLLERSWLCYSKRVGTVFCLTCKLFSKTPSQYTTGFSDWKHIGFCLENHENSNEHKNSMLVWLTRKENKSVLDKQLQEQLNKETEYYHNVLKRVIAVLKFLSIRGLALRGSEEVFGSPHNGNFMGALELLAEFDPFIREHIEQRKLRPNPVISYLSKTVYEEIIEIMGKQIIKQIITEINNDDTKYYSIMMDSTPDLSHDDQLAIVLRYCFRGKVYERCVSFIKISSHTGLYLFNILQAFLETNGLLLDNCRGQSYDNAANMAGVYNGVQALLKEKKKSADYVPCAAHSLNLVGQESVKVATEIVNFFGIVQQIYVFFSASTHRWELLNRETKLKFTLKSLSQTRWSCHFDAVRALKSNYDGIMKILNSFGENDDEKVDFRKEARNLFNKLAKLETAILIVFWEEILERFNVVNKKVQSPGLDIGEGNKLIVSLKEFVKNIWQQSDQKLKEYEEKAKKLSTSLGTDYSDINKRRITLKFSDKSTDKVSVNCAEKFKRDTLNVALDKMIMDLNNRSQAYETYSKKFKFLMDLQDKNQEHIDLESVRNIIDYYPNDVDEHLVNECIQLKSYLLQSKTESYTSCSEIFWLIYEKKLVDVFPNCYTILKIFLTMPITSCEAVRSFSRMSYIENKYRTTMSNYRLNHLSVLSINCDLTKDLQCDDQIKEFAAQKCRKVAL
ncbi:zinc finger MYM-type protein 1-like [Melitaea cinxia]|uniref:zinc finger MYM-type protein 1-like n=1 Tax=Melitaea cinxia TaxID=113334 RepID=UPI001E273A2C|nr:zinc finger MYM-type protein 1-like [Melitaea cinxia]